MIGDATSSERRYNQCAPEKVDGGQTQTHNGAVTPRRVMAAQSQKDGGRHVELEVIEAETTAMVEMVANQRAPGKGGQHQLSVVGKHDD